MLYTSHVQSGTLSIILRHGLHVLILYRLKFVFVARLKISLALCVLHDPSKDASVSRVRVDDALVSIEKVVVYAIVS